jgi:hypothetical protein
VAETWTLYSFPAGKGGDEIELAEPLFIGNRLRSNTHELAIIGLGIEEETAAKGSVGICTVDGRSIDGRPNSQGPSAFSQ